MSDYATLLALSFFKQYKDSYILSELMKILGADAEQLDSLIFELIDSGYIEYQNYMLTITEKGNAELVASNMNQYNDQDIDFIKLHVNQSAVWPIDKPYVPDKFMTKL